MTAPRLAAIVNASVYRPRQGTGRPCALTELQQVELVAWYKARAALGTWKTKARELGVTEAALQGIVERRLGLRRL